MRQSSHRADDSADAIPDQMHLRGWTEFALKLR